MYHKQVILMPQNANGPSGMDMAIIDIQSAEGTAVPEKYKGIGKDSPCRYMVNA